jgi:hypothetical protein
MILTILQNIPLWVWAVLLVLLALGLSQTRTRMITRPLVLLLPGVMIPLSLYAVSASFGASFAAFSAWAIGLAIAVTLNALVFLGPNGVRYNPDSRRFELPGSWVPLILMLTIFCARFVLGVATALSPSIVSTASFVLCVSAILGICSGLFLSRAMRTLSVQRAIVP